MTELSKAHGLSRSAVYRILESEKKNEQQAPPANSKETHEETEDDDRPAESFYFRNSKFADDLGLPDAPAQVHHDDSQPPPPVDDGTMDAILDGFMSNMERPQQVSVPVAVSRIPEPQQQQLQQSHSRYDIDDLVQRIVFNVQHFAPLLTTIIGTNHEAFIASLASREAYELKHLLTTIERTRSVGTISAGFKQVFYVAAQGVEVTSRLIGVKSQGFTHKLQQQDEEITMCMKEIALNEWERLKAMDSPQVRLGMLFCLTLAQTHTRNEMLEGAPVNPNLAEANVDL